jgi:hypothetical protein
MSTGCSHPGRLCPANDPNHCHCPCEGCTVAVVGAQVKRSKKAARGRKGQAPVFAEDEVIKVRWWQR